MDVLVGIEVGAIVSVGDSVAVGTVVGSCVVGRIARVTCTCTVWRIKTVTSRTSMMAVGSAVGERQDERSKPMKAKKQRSRRRRFVLLYQKTGDKR